MRVSPSALLRGGSPSSAGPCHQHPTGGAGLRDDPYRSLAAYVRYARGYTKPKPSADGNDRPEFFVEFKWAQVRRGGGRLSGAACSGMRDWQGGQGSW